MKRFQRALVIGWGLALLAFLVVFELWVGPLDALKPVHYGVAALVGVTAVVLSLRCVNVRQPADLQLVVSLLTVAVAINVTFLVLGAVLGVMFGPAIVELFAVNKYVALFAALLLMIIVSLPSTAAGIGTFLLVRKSGHEFARVLGILLSSIAALAIGGVVVYAGLAGLVRQLLLVFVMEVVIAAVLLSSIAIIGVVVAAFSKILPIVRVPLHYNLRNLVLRWKTTVVTAVAFTVVVTLLIVMLSFVAGMNRVTEGSGIPGNVLILSDGATDEVFSNLPRDASVERLPNDIQVLIAKDANGKYLATKEAYVLVNHVLANPEPGGRMRRFVQMRGLDDPETAGQVHGLELLKGRWWSQSGVGTTKVKVTRQGVTHEEYPKEIVMGDGVAGQFARDLRVPSLEPGQVLEVGPLTCMVVGILKATGSTFGSEVWARDSVVQEQFGRQNSYSSYVVRARDPARASEALQTGEIATARTVTDMIRKFKGAGDIALQAYPETDYYSKLTETNNQFLYAIIFVAIFMAIGGVLGIMNTMFAAISQRTKDIGMMRLLGFTRAQILVSFLFESLVIALAGGLLGCLIGFAFDGWTASSVVSGGPGGGGKSVVLRLVVSPEILGSGLGFALLMGAIGGLVPSLAAMRLKPLESLR